MQLSNRYTPAVCGHTLITAVLSVPVFTRYCWPVASSPHTYTLHSNGITGPINLHLILKNRGNIWKNATKRCTHWLRPDPNMTIHRLWFTKHLVIVWQQQWKVYYIEFQLKTFQVTDCTGCVHILSSDLLIHKLILFFNQLCVCVFAQSFCMGWWISHDFFFLYLFHHFTIKQWYTVYSAAMFVILRLVYSCVILFMLIIWHEGDIQYNDFSGIIGLIYVLTSSFICTMCF